MGRLTPSGGNSGGAIRSASVLTITHSTFSGNDSGLTETGSEAGAVTITHGTATLTNNIFADSRLQIVLSELGSLSLPQGT